MRSTPDFDLQIHVLAATQNGASTPEARARILKEIARLERAVENSKRQLEDPVFLSKAPEHVIGSLRSKLAGYENQLEHNRKLLESSE